LQILKLDPKRDTVKLRVENLDDLWAIYNTVQEGDLVYALTFRREKDEREDSRPDRGQRKPVYLGIRVQKIDFHKYVNAVRITGRIESGEDVGSFHTLNIVPGSVFSIVRKWRPSELENLRQTARESNRPIILVVSVEDGYAAFAAIRQRGIDMLDEVSINIQGKRSAGLREAQREAFYSAVADTISNICSSRDIRDVLIVGPELVRQGLKRFLEGRSSLLGDLRISYDTCFSPGRPGIYEAIRRGSVERVVSENRVSREVMAVEELLREIATDGKAVYGVEEVKRAATSGAVDKLLLTDSFFRENRELSEQVIRDTKRFSGSYLIVSTDHEGGAKLDGLGGIAAVLRYRLDSA